MERPLTEIKLPSKHKAKIVTFFTRGEAKKLKGVAMEGKKYKYVNDDVVIDEIPSNYRQIEEDALLEIGVKNLTDPTGNDVPVSVEAIDALPDGDVNLLLAELTKIRAGVEEEKKD